MIQSFFAKVSGRVVATYLTALSLLLVSCSGGETGTGENKTPQKNANSVDTTYIGPITAFGSIFVNGVEFDTSDADIDFNGELVGQSALTQGMLVRVEGTVDASGVKGVAQKVSYCSILKGPVDQVNRDPSNARVTSLKMLGQNVILDEITLSDSSLSTIKNADMLEAGNFIEVSGFQGLHEILATHIQIIDSASGQTDTYFINGPIMTLTAEYFDINDIRVYYDASSLINNQLDNLRTGMIVNVQGHYIDTADGTRFFADTISIDEHSSSDKMLEMEGYIVDPMNQGMFRVNRFPVTLAANTEIENGDLTTLSQVGTKLQLRGHLTVNGFIEAHKIEIKKAPTVEFVGNLQQVDIDQNSVIVFGRRVFVDNHTIIRDESQQNVQAINLSHFIPDDRVECDLQFDADLDLFVATKLERGEPSTSPDKLKGPLLSVQGKGSNIMVNIAGLELELSNADNHLFFNREIGTMVSVTGSYNSMQDVFQVSTVEFAM